MKWFIKNLLITVFLRVFGYACWPNLRPHNNHKINFISKTCIFNGYNPCHQGYKCFDLATGKIFVSRHVVFDESLFSYTCPKSFIKAAPSSSKYLSSNLKLQSSSLPLVLPTGTQSCSQAPLESNSPPLPSLSDPDPSHGRCSPDMNFILHMLMSPGATLQYIN